jgi:hypothetical protein
MDVGADNFRFTLEDQNGRKLPTQTMRQPATTEIHIDSLDRYQPQQLQTTAFFQNYPNSQNVAKLAGPILLSGSQSGTRAVIQPGRSIGYGYYSRIALTQMFLNWEVPTVVQNANDLIRVSYGIAPGTVSATVTVAIPSGYYTAATMATQLQTSIRNINVLLAAATVTAPSATFPGFQFSAGGSTFMSFVFGGPGTTEQQQVAIGRMAKLLGLNRACFGYASDPNPGGQPTTAPVQWAAANGGSSDLIYTDYVDVVSQSLTNYKDAKDDNSSLASPGAVLGRIWLTETTPLVPPAPNAQPNEPSNIGAGHLSLVKTWINPNWCQWSPNQALNTIDITLLDMFGIPIPWNSSFATEFSATLTLTE